MDEQKHNQGFDQLNTPGRRASFRLIRWDDDTFGRFAEWIARFMGSSHFIIWMTIFIVAWLAMNIIMPNPIDPNPFIMLTLLLSIEAAYSAPLIRLAQDRQENRDRMAMNEDRRVASQSRSDMDFLAREIASLRANVGEIATRDFIRTEIRDQLRELLSELDERELASANSEPNQP